MITQNTIRIICPEAEENERAAAALARELAGYRIPRDVARRTGIRRMEQVTEPWLIVLCTPETPEDPEVNAEIDRFIAEGEFAHILTLLLTDRPGECFPRQLLKETREDGTVIDREPLAANIAAGSERDSLKKLKTEKLRLIAPMLGVAYDDLMNRRRRARNRILAATGAAVLTGGLVFLGYALTRMNTISGQNRQLAQRYDEADAARAEAEAQRETAREEYVRTVALTALDEMENGNTEQALETCLAWLPEMGGVAEITDAFDRILRTMCAGEYVPVGTKYDYRNSRGLGSDLDDAYDQSTSRYSVLEDDYYLKVPSPEEYREKEAQLRLELYARSPSGKISVYGGKAAWVSFSEDPEKGYYLRDEEGKLRDLSLNSFTRGSSVPVLASAWILDDDTMIDILETEDRPYRIDLHTGKEIPLFDGEEGSGSEEKYSLLFAYDGTDVIFALRETAVEVWSRNPVRYLYSMDGMLDILPAGDANALIGRLEDGLAVCRKQPFEFLYKLTDDYIRQLGYLGYKTDGAVLADGRNCLRYGDVLYDLADGSVLADYRDVTVSTPEISLEGYVLTNGYRSVAIRDPLSGEQIASVRACLSDGLTDYSAFQPYGPTDPATGRRDVSAVALGSLVYEYRPAREIPDSLEEKIALAKELLEARGKGPEDAPEEAKND